MAKLRLLLCLVIIPVILFRGQSSTGSPKNPGFSSTYAQEALSHREIPGIISGHPRLFLRSEPWRHGPNLTDLKMWAQQEPLKSYLKNKPWSQKPSEELAFRYLLTGDERLVPPIVQQMKKEGAYWPGHLSWLATLYDWLYNSPSFSANDKKVVEDNMIRWARKAMEMGEQYADMWSHFGYRPPVDLAAAGLALHGHREEAKEYIAIAGGYIKRNMFPGWKLNDGAWQGGWAYYGQGCYNLFKFIAMWSSATSEDLFEIIEKEEGDWVRNHVYYLIYSMYPDHTPVESCGFNNAPDQRGGTNAMLLLTGAYKDLHGVRNLKWRNEWGWRLGIDQFLFLSPELRKSEEGQHTLPLTKCWGRRGVGYVQMRSGWGENDTIIEFKCGDYFWSHQSHNQNSFTIYRKGRLAIQSGIYAGKYFGPYMLNYYRPTVSSNTVQVIQPGEKTWIPPKAAKNHGSITDGDGYFPEFGGQRSCYVFPGLGSAETCFTFDKYLYRKNHDHHFETGNIGAFEVTDQYSYVSGDATMAYNNPAFCYPGNKPKINLFTRQLAFLNKKYLVIFDRVNSLDEKYDKRWLLHSIGEPRLFEQPVEVEYPGHREIYKGGLVRIDNKEGTLYCQTLFGGDYFIRKVGGSATITPARADRANKGNATLKTTVKGKYERASPTIASDRAQKEDWVIEFIDPDRFKIKGSIAGEDGIGSYKSSEIFISNTESVFIPKQNWEGIPQKGDKFYFSVTSPSHRFWVNDRNQYPPAKSLIHILKDGSHIDPGSWRIEVFPKKKEKVSTFLHLLHPCDRDSATPPVAEGIVSSDKVMQGLSIDEWIVLFGHKGTAPQKIAYLVKKSGRTLNLLLDMVPEKTYVINIERSSESTKQNIAASKEGTLFFTTPGVCRVEIAPL